MFLFSSSEALLKRGFREYSDWVLEQTKEQIAKNEAHPAGREANDWGVYVCDVTDDYMGLYPKECGVIRDGVNNSAHR